MLWPEEVKLAQHFLRTNEHALTWTEAERRLLLACQDSHYYSLPGSTRTSGMDPRGIATGAGLLAAGGVL